ncbi:MAG: alpha-amylase, partial [Chloroflexota bacterium]
YSDNQIIAYFRRAKDTPGFLVVLNLSHRPCYYRSSKVSINGTIELATDPEMEGYSIKDEINLSGDEGVIIRLAAE